MNRQDLSPALVGYALTLVQGLIAVVAPRRAARLSTAGTRLCFEGADGLQPRPWLVRATRVWGVGTLVTGLVGVVVELQADADDPTPALADVLPGGDAPDE